MILIIDGYNVLKQIYEGSFISDAQRHEFIKQVRQYAKVKNHQAFLIFDGGPSVYESMQTANSITIIYSGKNKSADDVIITYLERYTGKDALLVSSDLMLVTQAQRYAIPSIGAHDFMTYILTGLKERLQAPVVSGRPKKTTHESMLSVDELMQKIEKIPIKDAFSDKLYTPRKKAHTLSKRERLLQKKIKKL